MTKEHPIDECRVISVEDKNQIIKLLSYALVHSEASSEIKDAMNLLQNSMPLEPIMRNTFQAGGRRGYSQRSKMAGAIGINEPDEDNYIQTTTINFDK